MRPIKLSSPAHPNVLRLVRLVNTYVEAVESNASGSDAQTIAAMEAARDDVHTALHDLGGYVLDLSREREHHARVRAARTK